MIKFERHPEIALSAEEYESGGYSTWYSRDYGAIFRDVALGKLKERDVLRWLFVNDLWFLVNYGFAIPDDSAWNGEKAHHPFVVRMCREVEEGPKSDTLDIWARFHWKMLPINEPVFTPDGWRKHGDLRKGDRVFGSDGFPCNVVAKTETFFDGDCYRITFDKGYTVVAGGEHLWDVELHSRERVKGNLRKGRKKKVITTRELMKEVALAHEYKSRVFPSVAVCKPLLFNWSTLPIEPYTLGVWLGDGTSVNGDITCGDNDILQRISLVYQLGKNKYRNGNAQCRKIVGLSKKLKELGIQGKGQKRIPLIYQTAAIEDRIILLQGLMDTDGHCDTRGTATFCNTNKKLAEDVFFLVAGLGLKPGFRKHIRKVNGADYDVFNVSFQTTYRFPVFGLQRKQERTIVQKATRSLRHAIIKVEPVPSEPCSCIQVDSEDGCYLIGNHLIPTHNSTIITQAETLQFQIKNPDKCTGIFCYARPAAKKPLRSIKNLLEGSDLLKWCFPGVFWKKPETESPKWSEDDGLVLKRSNHSRKESSIEAHGLIEGMPTGSHFERAVYDDLETDDIRESPDMLEKVFSKFQMAMVNLGTGSNNDQRRVIGTYYSHFGPNVKIRDMKYPNGDNIFHLRLVPATDDGSREGKPVLMESTAWEIAKMSKHFNSQQLCDPTPSSEIRLNASYLKPVEPQFIPKGIYKFMVLDQAGGDETEKQSKDLWSYGVVGIEPVLDDIGQSNVYLMDIEADRMSHSEGIEGVCRMYMRNGIIQQFGVEKVGLSTTEMHISNALRMKGRRLSLDGGNLVLLKPAGRSKERRVEQALQWPLNNGKLFYSKAIPQKYIDALIEEMNKFPFYHVDILDMLAYAYDLFKEYRFPVNRRTDKVEESPVNPLMFGLRGGEGLRVRV